MQDDHLIPERLTASMVRSYIDFDGHTGTSSATSLQAQLQSEGVAGLWQLMREHGFAYLADEVGMGKTRQAMGVIATQFLSKPDSRVVIICSSDTLQRQWQSEWAQFLRICYRLLDDCLLGSADAAQLEDLHMHQNLRAFARSLRAAEVRIHLLRYSSFSRPLSLNEKSPGDMLTAYAACLGDRGLDTLTPSECAILDRHRDAADGWNEAMRHELAHAYCQRIAQLLTHGSNESGMPLAPLDLLICDEAQYLRHTGNHQNTNLAAIFRGNVRRWLFLSATPLHSSANDIRSLDAYLCRRAPGAAVSQGCSKCTPANACARLGSRLDSDPKHDVVDLLKEMMIRRTRTYADGDKERYGKMEYRNYQRVRHSGAHDPFLAFTMALVQKRLVGALAGKNNKFRQGECASFESLSSSVGRIVGVVARTTQEAEPEFETAADGPRKTKDHDEPSAALDRNVIDYLNQDFVRSMGLSPGHGLPHAKLNSTVDELFERSLRDGSIEKTLVFVRRIDTVEEMRDLLHRKFQNDLDERIEAWRRLLASPGISSKDVLWRDNFWARDDDEADDVIDPMEAVPDHSDHEGDAPDGGPAGGNRGFRQQVTLDYFEAVRQGKKPHERHGKLYSFRARLLTASRIETMPLRGFLHKIPDGQDHDQPQGFWERNEQRWQRFLAATLGTERSQSRLTDPQSAWLWGSTAGNTQGAFKLAALQRCLLQVMRQTDFVVDLYVMHRYLLRTPAGEQGLPEKLLWLLENDGAVLPAKLAIYVANIKLKFQRWIEHFELIVDKCFRGGGAASWQTIYSERILSAFKSLAPIVGRSGRLENGHAVTQFKFPTFPNILICTDVLKEGVDMHLFCDRVEHYGVAWTSGDLEQRIGRIDRLGSQIGRKLGDYRKQDGDKPPQLGVAFPYLEGTLDQYQVDTVIKAKMVSNLRMDLGKRKDEIGDICISNLFQRDRDAGARRAQNQPDDGVVFFPERVRFVRDSDGKEELPLPADIRIKDATDIEPGGACEGEAVEEMKHLPAYRAVLVRRRVESDHHMLRACLGTGKRPAVEHTEEFLAPCSATTTVSPAAVMDGRQTYGVRQPPSSRFYFDAESNTCVAKVDAREVGGAVSAMVPVILEVVGEEFWILRSLVEPVSACSGPSRRGGVESWMAERNRDRRFGYLTADGRQIWFVVIVRRAEGSASLLDSLVSTVARSALFYGGHDRGGTLEPYWARSPFPSIYRSLTWRTPMEPHDLINAGQVLIGVQAWFEDAFSEVVDGLYGPNVVPDERGLQVRSLAFLPGGVLHLRVEGAERFWLQAYLDLNASGGPCMRWELVATPNSKGPRPRLSGSDYNDMPHLLPEGWEGEARCSAVAYTAKNERDYRYLAFYHSPLDWDRASRRLVEAWSAALHSMREDGNFQRMRCRNLLLDALASGIPEMTYMEKTSRDVPTELQADAQSVGFVFKQIEGADLGCAIDSGGTPNP